jgi:abequosyltransferase
MTKLLTIAIPTFNRALLLDRQLEWLSSTVEDYKTQCEIIVSDNCSSDNTSKIVSQWKSKLTAITFRAYRNNENIGAIRNITKCIDLAEGEYVWVISDDDEIENSAIEKIVKNLQSYPNLGLAVLNFSGISVDTGELLFSQRYITIKDDFFSDGKSFFEKYLAIEYGGLVLTSALVCKTSFAQKAISQWKSGSENLLFQLYISAFCAKEGSAILIKDSLVKWMSGRAFFQGDPNFTIQMHLKDHQSIYLKLAQIGYSQKLCRDLTTRRFLNIEWLSLVVKMLIKYPIRSAKSLSETFVVLWSFWFRQISPKPGNTHFVGEMNNK